MNTFSVVLFAILIAGAGAGLIWLAVRCLPDSKYRNMYFGGAGAVTLLMLVLFCVTAALPRKVNNLLRNGSTEIEQQIETLAPGKTNEVLSTDELKTILSNTRQFSSFEGVDGDMGLVVRLIASNVIGDRIEQLCNNVETEMALFEQTGNKVTIHNILNYLVVRTDEPVHKAAKVLEIIVLVAALICFIALVVLIWAIRKEYFSKESNGIVFGDDVNKEEESDTKE